MLDWTKEYGNIFQLRLLTDNRVRVFTFPPLWSINRTSPADNYGRTPPCQGRLFNQVAFMSDFDYLSSTKAILATQFDAFEKGKLRRSNMVERSLINEFFRTYVPLPIQVVTGRRSFQCWWYATIFSTCHYLLTDRDLYRWNVEVRIHFCYTWNFQPYSKTSRFHRAMTRPFFTRERINDFDIYDKISASTLKLAKTRLAEGYPVEFQVHFFTHQSTPLLTTHVMRRI